MAVELVIVARVAVARVIVARGAVARVIVACEAVIFVSEVHVVQSTNLLISESNC